MSNNYDQGFADQQHEITLENLEIEGTIPSWLHGTLVRNGPARFRLQDKTLNHWFDGLAMLHSFTIDGTAGRVSYANKFLDTPALHAAEDGKMLYPEFATDPCRSLFKRLTNVFHPTEFGANANISIGKIADDFVAQAEVPMPVAFDKDTLATIGVIKYDDQLRGDVTTAHPHYDTQTQESLNYLLSFGPKSTYEVYKLPDGTVTRQRIGSTTVASPSYMHSFGLSETYVILMEFPFVVNPIGMILSGKPFIANYKWKPERGTRFSLFNRKTGEIQYVHTDEAWFGFHHVNAVDRDGKIDLDIVVYPSAEVVQHFYLSTLLKSENRNSYPKSELRRFTIDPASGMVESRTLVDYSAELPRINYDHYNMKPYKYVYANGIAPENHSAFLDSIVKFNVETGGVTEWRQNDQFPGEPVYIVRPGAVTEDDGLLLSVVLDTSKNTSYMVILDAHDLSEIARARLPQHVPFGFHGMFING